MIMNPPFADKADIAHVRHALGFLRPGGLLIAVMAGGVTFREDRATAGFRELVEDAADCSSRCPKAPSKYLGRAFVPSSPPFPQQRDQEQAA